MSNHERIAIVLALLLDTTAHAQCRMGPLRPLVVSHDFDGLVPKEEAPWSYLAVLLDHDGSGGTLLDPADPRRHVEVDQGVKLGVFTPTRAVAVAPYGNGRVWVGAARGGPMKPLLDSDDLRPLVDAADGANGETLIALAGKLAGSYGLGVARIDASGKLRGVTSIARRDVRQARLTRVGDRFALAYVTAGGGRWLHVETLWLAFLDGSGAPVAPPARVDTARGEQMLVEIALAPSERGVVLAWNPIAGGGSKKDVPIELRAFIAEPASAPRLVRRERLSSATWAVAGSAGGYLPNALQAVAFAKRAVLVWLDFRSNDSTPLVAVPAERGAPSVIAEQPPGYPKLQRDGQLVFWDRNAGKHQQAALLCPAADGPAPSPAPLPPLEEEPVPQTLSPQQLDQAWQHALALLDADPKGKKYAAKIRKGGDERRNEALTQLSEERRDARWECVIAAATVDELGACQWP
jgi:hypothetical protein